MGMPARRIEANPFQKSSHLRLVTTPPAPATTTRTRSTAGKPASKPAAKRTVARAAVSASTRARVKREEARARTVFGVFVVALICAIALGGARVTLIAKAAEVSITEGRVQAEIKAQRAETDKLEVDRSALSTPSRIAGIASSSMDMGEPRSVRYISMDGGTAQDAANAAATTVSEAGSAVSDNSVSSLDAASSPDILGRFIGLVMDLSAGEAQSLLVGDLGLAGSR